MSTADVRPIGKITNMPITIVNEACSHQSIWVLKARGRDVTATAAGAPDLGSSPGAACPKMYPWLSTAFVDPLALHEGSVLEQKIRRDHETAKSTTTGHFDANGRDRLSLQSARRLALPNKATSYPCRAPHARRRGEASRSDPRGLRSTVPRGQASPRTT